MPPCGHKVVQMHPEQPGSKQYGKKHKQKTNFALSPLLTPRKGHAIMLRPHSSQIQPTHILTPIAAKYKPPKKSHRRREPHNKHFDINILIYMWISGNSSCSSGLKRLWWLFTRLSKAEEAKLNSSRKKSAECKLKNR